MGGECTWFPQGEEINDSSTTSQKNDNHREEGEFFLIELFRLFFFLIFLPFFHPQITPWEAFKSELKFALMIWVTTKPVHNRISESSASSKRSSKSRAVSESATNAIHGSSMMQLDKDSNYSAARH